jgi:hypothetical protein
MYDRDDLLAKIEILEKDKKVDITILSRIE